MTYLSWLRTRLDEAGRNDQMILALTDGAFDVLEMWQGSTSK